MPKVYLVGLFLAPMLVSVPAFAAFSNSNLSGTCGFGLASLSSGGNTGGALGLFTFDGAGNLSGKVALADNGNDGFTDFTTFSGGSYSVNSDGTGTANFSLGSSNASLSFAIDNRGNEVRGVIDKTGKAGFFRCRMQTASLAPPDGRSNLGGNYAFLFVEDGGPSATTLSGTSAAVGVMSLDGAGNVSGNVAVSSTSASSFQPFTSFSGTYTFNSSTLTGSLVFTADGIQFTMPFTVGNSYSEIRTIDSANGVAGLLEARLQ